MNAPQQNHEPDSDIYKALLESTKAIPWRIDWKTMQFSYIGPQIEMLLGWSPSSWVNVDNWATRMHPDDRERVVDFCVTQSKAGIDHETDYRAIARDGHYVWIHNVVHIVRKDGEIEALVGFMFDISENKAAEESLLRLQKELVELSYMDGLTGVANRRMFNMTVELEWANARRNHQPLSLIMLDIDCFKEYNDHYGHLQGDDCLKLVAQTLATAAARPRDSVARFGGEEFMLVLPETDAKAAVVVAERCRQAIEHLAIQHDHSPICKRLTISLGVGTLEPGTDEDIQHLIHRVDGLLYMAKNNGRNRSVCEINDVDVAPRQDAA